MKRSFPSHFLVSSTILTQLLDIKQCLEDEQSKIHMVCGGMGEGKMHASIYPFPSPLTGGVRERVDHLCLLPAAAHRRVGNDTCQGAIPELTLLSGVQVDQL